MEKKYYANRIFFIFLKFSPKRTEFRLGILKGSYRVTSRPSKFFAKEV